jgi:hypothetical protein
MTDTVVVAMNIAQWDVVLSPDSGAFGRRSLAEQ